MPIFQLEAFGQPARLPTGSTAESQDDAFAETLAAALASTSAVPSRSVGGDPNIGPRDGNMTRGGRSVTGADDLPRDLEPVSGNPEVPADTRTQTSAMAAQQTSGAVPTDVTSSADGPPAPAAGSASLLLDGNLTSSAVIATSGESGQSSPGLTGLVPGEAAPGQAQQGATPGKSHVYDGVRDLDGQRSLRQEQAAALSAGRDALLRQGGATNIEAAIAGTANPENSLPGDRAREKAAQLSQSGDGYSGRMDGLPSPARVPGASVYLDSLQTQPGAGASINSQSDGAEAAPSPPATSNAEQAISRSLQLAAISVSTRSAIGHPLDGEAQRDPGLSVAGQSAQGSVQSARPVGERQAEIAASTSTTFGVRASLADRPETAGSADEALRKRGAHGAPIASHGVDGQTTQTTVSTNPANQALALDAGARPNGESFGSERMQPTLSVDGAAADVEQRFEPAAALGTSRTQAPATNPAPAAQVALQIVRALPGGGDRFSVHLQPAELGRVDIQLTFEGQGRLSALITAERPETLELLQRDGRLLERSLGDSGLKLANDGVSFALKQDQQQQQGQNFHEQAQDRQAAFQAGRAYDDASDTEQRPPALRVDGLRLLDIHT